MNVKEFKQRFAMMCACLRFAPKVDEVDSIWFHMSLQDMSDEEIIKAFTRAKNELKEFPAYSEFVALGKDQVDEQDQVDLITANVMYCLAKGGAPESSGWVLDKCGPIGYEAIGGHMGWYDIMNGVVKKPREMEIRNNVKAYVKEEKQEQMKLRSADKQKQLGGQDVARI